MLFANTPWESPQFILFILVGIALVIYCIGSLLSSVGHHIYGELATTPTETDVIPLEDGWDIVIDRHLPDQEPLGVVITCHGMNMNAHNMDVSKDISLVGYLKERGYEVWNVDLRGVGRSRFSYDKEKLDGDWSFDDYIRYDVPGILQHVTKRSGFEKVHWIGHSMGGMIMYAYLGSHPEEERIASVCTVGSPVVLIKDTITKALAYFGRFLVLFIKRLPTDRLAKSVALLTIRLPFGIYICRPFNISGNAYRRCVYNALSPLSRGLVKQFSRWMLTKTMDSEDGQWDYRQSLQDIQVPFCFVVGKSDQLAAEVNVRPAFEELGSSQKETVVVPFKYQDIHITLRNSFHL